MAICPNPECRNTQLMFVVDDISNIECQECRTKWSTYKHSRNDPDYIISINIPFGAYRGKYEDNKVIKNLLQV